jgi:hypothetical protein
MPTLDNINERIQSIPTALRHVPGLANYSQHVLRVYEKAADGRYTKLVGESRRERSGIVTAVDLYKKENHPERQRLTNQNVEQLIATTLAERAWHYHDSGGRLHDSYLVELPITIQTLLSPGLLNTLINGRGSNNNTAMVATKEKAIENFRNALASNNHDYFAKLGLELGVNGAILFTKNGETIAVKPVLISTNHAVNAWRKIPVPFSQSNTALNKKTVMN